MSVWGSKTFVEPVQIDNQLRVRAIVALPASLTSFCTVRGYRTFFLEMRDALWKLNFTTRLLFYDSNDAQLPNFAELLLKYNPDIVISFLPVPKTKGSVARLTDCGIRVISITDYPLGYGKHRYYVDRERAIKEALHSWQQTGVRSVTVLRNCHCGSLNTLAMVEKCLRDRTMPYALVNAESLQFQDPFPACSQQMNRGIIFPSSELAVALAVRDPARFARLSEQSRVMLMDGLIDVPSAYELSLSIDTIEVDWVAAARRLASDLIKPTRRSPSAEPVIFEAKWVPGTSKNRPAH